ncbi:MAG: hypothetical protein EOO70_03675 [Myxococcaceae bacterium]|nr:MAG: hypothetical protein EOO70_03675 [Myxococcaceae bacterium]
MVPGSAASLSRPSRRTLTSGYPWATLALGLMLSSSGCATVFLQEDGFRQRADRECLDEDSCERLLVEAQRREASCETNTIGKVRCQEAQHDVRSLQSTVSRHQRARAQRERDALAERQRQEQEGRSERESARRAEREATARRIDEAVKESQQQAEAARQTEQARAALVLAWQQQEARTCASRWTSEACASPPEQAQASEVEACRSSCATQAEQSARTFVEEALQACVAAYVASAGRTTPACAFTVPPSAASRYQSLPALCGQRCVAAGRAQLAEARTEPARRPASPPPARPSPPPATGGGNRVTCCDGTLSPSCTYDRPSLRGCCSHHGGVC